MNLFGELMRIERDVLALKAQQDFILQQQQALSAVVQQIFILVQPPKIASIQLELGTPVPQ